MPKNKAPINYLQRRGIDSKIAIPYIQEVYYTFNEKQKPFFASAFKKDKGGYEFRSRFFKGGTSTKYISTIEGATKQQLNIFEGFMDFISALHYKKTVANQFICTK